MRKTPLLKAVVEIFEKTHKPLCVADLQELTAKQGLEPNLTTLYRMLERLESEGVINQILLDSKTAYYEHNSDHQHHHFVCQDCDSVTCVDDPDLMQTVNGLAGRLQQKGMQVKKHDFLLAGKCAECA